ncbi:hypothetical protein AB1N83_013789 [Pleurotus pulmonarius]
MEIWLTVAWWDSTAYFWSHIWTGSADVSETFDGSADEVDRTLRIQHLRDKISSLRFRPSIPSSELC